VPEELAPAPNLSAALLCVLLAHMNALRAYRPSQTHQRFGGRPASCAAFLADIENHANAHISDCYRLLLTGHIEARNQREQAMFRTLQRIDTRLLRRTLHARTIALWA
jgi:hypothetical protein